MSERAEAPGANLWGDVDDTEALQRYRTLVSTIDDGIYQLDAEGRFVAVDDDVVEMTGYAREELLGERVSALFGDGSAVERELERLHANPAERNEPLEVTVRTATGDPVRCEVRTSPLETDGSVQGSVGVVRELGGRERSPDERELERYERIVDNLPVGVYRNTPGPDGEFVAGNSTLASIFDADSVDELFEHDVSDLYADSEQRAEFSRRLRREGAVEDVGLKQESLAGETLWISVTAIRTEEDGEVYFDGIVQDVTEQREREKELEAHSAAMEETVDGIAILDENEEYVFANQAHADIYGYDDPGAFLGETWRMCYGDEEVERLESEAMPVLAEEGSWRGEATGVCADGSTFPQELSLTGLDDGRYVCVVRDVTERKEREREMKRSDVLFTKSRDVNAVLERDGTFRYLTPSTASVLGYDPDALVGENAFDYVHPEDRERVTETYAEMVENPAFEPTVEFRFRHADGSWIVLETQGRNLLDESEIEGIVVYSRDVTERTEREQSLERYETIVEAVNDGVYVVDDDGTFRMVNRAYTEMTGYSREELVGSSVDKVVDEEVARRAQELELTVGAGDEGPTMEADLRTASGERVPVEATFASLPADGHEYRVGVVRDVTERKEREKELELKERQFQAVFDDPNILVGLLDPDGTVRNINRTAMEYVDADLEEVTGEPFWETPWWGEGDAIQSDVERWVERAAAGEYVDFEADLTRPDGQRYVIEGVFRPVTDDDGEVVSLVVSDRDVTERKERERQLAESERRYRTLAENVPNGLVTLFDSDFEYTLAAGQGFDDIPPDPADVEGESFRDVWDDDTVETLEPLFEAALDGEERSVELEYAGREWVVYAVPIADERGDVSAGMTLAQDITERKEAQRRTEESERRYRTLVENFPDGAVGLFDEDLRYTAVGGELTDAFGVDPDDRVDESILDVYPDELVAEIEPHFSAALDSETNAFEVEYHDRHLLAHTLPVRDDDGEVFAGMIVVQDVTERKEAQRELESRARQQAAISELGQSALETDDLDALFDQASRLVADVLDNDYCKVLDLDDDAQELLLRQGVGWREGIVGEATVSSVESDSQASYTLLSREPVVVEDLDVETRFSGPDLLTSHGVKSGVSTIIGSSEQPWGILGTHDTERRSFTAEDVAFVQSVANILADAIERRTYRTELEETVERLEASNKRLENFAGMLAHELRNPVTIGQIYCQRLPTEAAPEAVDYVTEAFERIEDMIDVMLVLTRGDEATGERRPVQFAAAAEAAWEEVDAPEATLEAEIDYTIPADETYVRHLFRNLFENAVEHGGSDVTITVGELPDGFYVADDGAGIWADDPDVVFEEGYTTTAENGGTGLGLAFVRELAAVYGWTYAVTESASGGARFEFRNVGGDSE